MRERVVMRRRAAESGERNSERATREGAAERPVGHKPVTRRGATPLRGSSLVSIAHIAVARFVCRALCRVCRSAGGDAETAAEVKEDRDGPRSARWQTGPRFVSPRSRFDTIGQSRIVDRRHERQWLGGLLAVRER